MTSAWKSTGGIVTIFVGVTIAALMQTFLTVSMPTATTEVDALAWYGWLPGVYMVSSTVFIPIFAAQTDRHGPRGVYVVSFLVWAAGTVMLGCADTAAALLCSRVIQGVGAAGVVPASVSALAMINEEKFGRLIGATGAVQTAAIVAGGPIGGWIATSWGWRVSLWGAALAATIPIVLAIVCLPTNRHLSSRDLNIRAILGKPGVCFILLQTMAIAGISYGSISYLPLLLEEVHGLSVQLTGWVIVPSLAGVAAGTLWGGYRPDHWFAEYGVWALICVGALCCLFPHLAFAAIGGTFISFSAGAGLSRQMVLLERITTAQAAGAAGGLMQASRNCGGAIGTISLGLPMFLGHTAEIGAHLAFGTLAFFACVAAVVFVSIIRTRPLSEPTT